MEIDPDATQKMPQSVGATFFDERFELIEPIGQGSYGVVWKARDVTLDRAVALKFLPDILRMDEEAVKDLLDETKRSLELTHPNIVRVFDLHRDSEAVAIAMELIEGKSLSATKAGKETPFFEVDEIKPWVMQICQAISYAHRKGKVVHRDIKPQNVMLDLEGDAKVCDFGISKSVTDTFTRLTGTAIEFTPSYGSPEQAMGAAPDERQDVYSIGALIFDLVTGKPPFFRGDVLAQLRELVPPTMAERREELGAKGNPIPEHWERTVAACLAKDPAERPATVDELMGRLLLADHDPETKSNAKPWLVPLIVGTVAILAGLVYLMTNQPETSSDNTNLAAASENRLPENSSVTEASPQKTDTDPDRASPDNVTADDTAAQAGSPTPSNSDSPVAPAPPQPEKVVVKKPDPAPIGDASTTAGNAPPVTAITKTEAEPPTTATTQKPAMPQVTSPPDQATTEQAHATAAAPKTKNPEPPAAKPKPEPVSKTIPFGENFSLPGSLIEMIWIPPIESWVSKSEITQKQFALGGGIATSRFPDGKRALDSVTFLQAMDFCKKADQREAEEGRIPEGYHFTLPTEAQWQVFVADSGLEHSVYGGKESDGPSEPGSKEENLFGLVDVRGNLWEWTTTPYDENDPSKGRALRGGSYMTTAKMLMDPGARFYGAEDNSYFKYGFRMILTKKTD